MGPTVGPPLGGAGEPLLGDPGALSPVDTLEREGPDEVRVGWVDGGGGREGPSLLERISPSPGSLQALPTFMKWGAWERPEFLSRSFSRLDKDKLDKLKLAPHGEDVPKQHKVNVVFEGMKGKMWIYVGDLFHSLVNLKWSWFLLLLCAAYFLQYLVFGVLYYFEYEVSTRARRAGRSGGLTQMKSASRTRTASGTRCVFRFRPSRRLDTAPWRR